MNPQKPKLMPDCIQHLGFLQLPAFLALLLRTQGDPTFQGLQLLLGWMDPSPSFPCAGSGIADTSEGAAGTRILPGILWDLWLIPNFSCGPLERPRDFPAGSLC